jgi:hypothetical protein
MWHAGGTAGENDRASHSVADASARPMGEVVQGDTSLVGKGASLQQRPAAILTYRATGRRRSDCFRIGQGGQCAAG